MKLVTPTSLQLLLIQNELQAKTLYDLSHIFQIAQSNDISEVYTSLNLITPQLIRCSKQYAFKVIGVVDTLQGLNSEVDINDISVLGLGGYKTAEYIYKKYPNAEVWNDISPLITYQNTRLASHTAILYHNDHTQLNQTALECLTADMPNPIYCFSNKQLQNTLHNYIGIAPIDALIHYLLPSNKFLICFDESEIGLTSPQIYLSHNILCMCHEDIDTEGIADFPKFSNDIELKELFNKYSDEQVYADKLLELSTRE